MIIWINHLAAQWAEFFGWAVVQNTVFLGIIILILRLMKEAPARVGYWIGLTGLIKLIIPPFLTAPFLKPDPIILSSVGLINIQPVVSSVEPPPLPPPALDLAAILLLTWITLLLVFLIWPLIATIRMKRQLSGATPVDNWKADGIRILKTDRINVPMTFGIFRESIYVPNMWDDWSNETRRMILAHEIAHIHRKDGLGKVFQILIQALYFFHPMMWVVSRKMNEFREMACDDMSTQSKKTLSVEYSRALVQIAERLVQSTVDCPSASALIRRKNELLNRVQYQMEDTMKTISRKRTALILAGLLALTAPLSWMKAKPAVEEPTAQTEHQEYETQLMSLPEGGFEAIQKNLVYPEAARKAGLEGKVTVEVLYTEKGFKSASVKESSFESGKDLGCHQAALDAVKSVKWSNIKNAKEAGGYMNVPLVFALDQAKSSEASTVIKGTLRDKETNDLLPGTKVELQGTDFSCVADENAEFYMDGIPAGSYQVEFTLDGRLISSMPLEVSSADTWNLEMTLNTNNPVMANTGKIHGNVTDTEGNPLPGTNITLKGTHIGAAADHSGNFRIINVPPGIYTLQASHIGYRSVLIQDVRVAVNESEEVNIQLEEGIIDMTTAVSSDVNQNSASVDTDSNKKSAELLSYLDWLAQEIPSRYQKPSEKFSGNQNFVWVNFQISPSGEITPLSVRESCGDEVYDKAAMQAVEQVEPRKITLSNSFESATMVDLQVSAPPPPPQKDGEIVFVPYDSPPQPIGGFEAIQQNLVYPELARKAGVEGRVLVYVQVDEKGEVSRTRAIQSLGPNGCDEAAVAAVKAVKWKPAQQRDQKVKVWIAVPVDFKLGSDNKSNVGMSDSDPYAEQKIMACYQNQKSIESAAHIGYEKNMKNGDARYPKDIADMVSMGLFPATPRCPDGGTYIYDSSTGKVTCSIPGHKRNPSSATSK